MPQSGTVLLTGLGSFIGSHPVDQPLPGGWRVTVVEQLLGKTAQVERLPRQLRGMRRTCSDICKVQHLRDFRPQADFAVGLRYFVGARRVELHREARPA